MLTEHIPICREDSIKLMQEKFGEFFPSLWIKVFKHGGGNDPEREENFLFSPQVRLKEINPDFEEGTLIISGNMRVGEMEQIFFDRFGLFVQVSLKNGNSVPDTDRIEDYLLKSIPEQENPVQPEHTNRLYFRDVPFGC